MKIVAAFSLGFTTLLTLGHTVASDWPIRWHNNRLLLPATLALSIICIINAEERKPKRRK